jgi:speckle-type POZ protein
MSMPRAMDLSMSTAAATASATKCHLFKIEGYKRIKILYGNGKSVDSCPFEAAGRTWRIQFFPDGNKKETVGFISLYLKLEDAAGAENDAGDDVLLAEVNLGLVQHHHGGSTSKSAFNFRFTGTFNKDRKVMGYPQFIKREELEKSEFLVDDCLAFRCDVAVLKQSVDAVEQAAQASDMERLGIVCECKDDACKGHHIRGGALWLRNAFTMFFLGCFQP